MLKKYDALQKREQDPELNRAYRDFKDHLAHQPKANAIGRVVLHMLLNCGGSFYWRVDTQMIELGLSRWQINKGRRIAVEAGLLATKDKKNYERVVVKGQSLPKRFNRCQEIDLGFRSQTLRIDLATRTADGKAHGSTAELAQMLGASSSWTVARAVAAADAKVDLFEIERFDDKRHAYRPKLELVGYELGAIKDGNRKPGTRSTRFIMAIEFGMRHPRIVESFIKDIVKPARRLQLTESKELLTRTLAKLYQAIDAERAASNLTADQKLRVGGPLQVLRDYIQYLEEELPKLPPDYIASVNVLKLEAPMFRQFRKRHLHLEHIDPINGSQNWYIE